MITGVEFYPGSAGEVQLVNNRGVHPKHMNYCCGNCGDTTNGRVITRTQRDDGSLVHMCICSCPKATPTILIERGNSVVVQFPEAREFRPGSNWPPDLAKLFEEGAMAYGAGAYTATAMVCRKLLMVCACHEGDTDGKKFVQYVDYITNTVLTFPKAKAAIDKIRDIGNDASHQIDFVSQENAKKAMSIVTYMLTAIYSLPSA